MSNPTIPIELSDDDDDDGNNNYNKKNDFETPVSNNGKRFRSFAHNPDTIIDIDDPTPPSKIPKSSSPTISFVPETPFSELTKLNNRPLISCTANLPKPNSGFALNSSGEELICVGSDDETGGPEKGICLKNTRACAGFDVENDSERSLECTVKEKQLENKESVTDIDIERWLDIESPYILHQGVESNVHVEGEGGFGKGRLVESYIQDSVRRPKIVAKENCLENERITASSHVDFSEKYPTLAQSTYHLGNLKSKKTNENTLMEDDFIAIQPVQDRDHDKENLRLEEEFANPKPKLGGRANAEKKQKKEEQAASRKKSMEEKKRKKEQEKAEAAQLKQLEKEKKKLEKYKFSEKDIVAEIDLKLMSGLLGGHLLTMFEQKHLNHNVISNPIKKSIVWRMNLPEGMSQVAAVKSDIHYILLIYNDAEEFCKHANDGSFIDHISSARKHYPSYTICCLTNRLMSFINKREQQKYKNPKDVSDWRRPAVEELFAMLTTQFTNVHSRQCADEAEVVEHVVGLTINLAKCHSRKKLTHLSVSANGANVPKDCVDRPLIMKNPWLKALISIPKVQPRCAIAIWKKYPTMKSLLHVYMDPMKTVDEKESLLEDLPLEHLGTSPRRLGEKHSKRVFRVLMAQNGNLNAEDAEDGADFFHSQS